MNNALSTFRLIDTHCHLDLLRDTQGVVDEINRERVCTIAVTNAPFLFAHTQKLCEQSELLFPALGMHPELVHSHGDQVEQFYQLLPSTRFVGEIGLDYVTPDKANRERQRRVFQKILSWCSESGDKILTVHSRRSSPDVIAAIGSDFPGTVILHWYSGSLRDLRKGLDCGFYFSVNPAMVRSEQGIRLIREVPRGRLLTETDSPFVTIDREPATPGAAKSVCEAIADIWSCSAEEVENTVRNTFVSVSRPDPR